jgi:hypothetical protein
MVPVTPSVPEIVVLFDKAVVPYTTTLFDNVETPDIVRLPVTWTFPEFESVAELIVPPTWTFPLLLRVADVMAPTT